MRFLVHAVTILAFAVSCGAKAQDKEEYIGGKPTYKTVEDEGKKAQRFATGLIIPKDFKEKMKASKDAKAYPLYDGKLPDAWDWRDKAKIPVRNQGNCGSCWSFARTGAFEYNVLLHGLPAVDLAEQELVSCDKNNYGCNGGFFPQEYEKKHGLGLESDFPYTASDARCKSIPVAHKIMDYAFVSSEDEIPNDEKLQRALYTYGPLAIGVAADNGWMSYSSGVYNRKGSSGVNHMIILVGWGKDEGGLFWIVKNSWGANWGEGGFMRTRSRCSMINYGATMTIYDGKPLTPVDPTPPPPPPPPPGPDPKPEPSMPWTLIGLVALVALAVGAGIMWIVKRK